MIAFPATTATRRLLSSSRIIIGNSSSSSSRRCLSNHGQEAVGRLKDALEQYRVQK
jgi:hypothetical protein